MLSGVHGQSDESRSVARSGTLHASKPLSLNGENNIENDQVAQVCCHRTDVILSTLLDNRVYAQESGILNHM